MHCAASPLTSRVDGPRAGLHDASRGVPGSWRRAIEGIDRLLCAGVGVCVVHVVTPANAAEVGGVPRTDVDAGRALGADDAGGDDRRGGAGWRLEGFARRRCSGRLDEFRERRGSAMRVTVQPGTGGTPSASRDARRRAATWCGPTATFDPTRCGPSPSATRSPTGSRPAGRRSQGTGTTSGSIAGRSDEGAGGFAEVGSRAVPR